MKSCFEKQGTEICSEGTNQSSSFMKQRSNKKIYYLYFVVKNVPKYVKKEQLCGDSTAQTFYRLLLKGDAALSWSEIAKSLATPH